MNRKNRLWQILRAVSGLLFKIIVLCFYIVSSLVEIILKNLNQYIKQKL